MFLLDSMRRKVTPIQSAQSNTTCGRPAVWRRALAALIDRLAPLPFLVFFFSEWALVVLVYHLLCDGSPSRRSAGKWICRLRVANAEGNQCHFGQAIGRRVMVAAAQTAWCLWQFIPWVLVYELGAVACVLLDAQGRRPEDFLTGTRVLTEKAFRQSKCKEVEHA